ncbi:MAG: hypothetical protein EA420_02165 [Candidatus Competibacteraceae bacterium]|nr:MAG: hypothetical protein EA420_02165 [Candidatus Competibacteraceae bacterium]
MTPGAPRPLPAADHLNIGALAGLFRHTTNSYKYLFFIALLDLLKRHRFDAERPYTYTEITVEMLAIAWFAHTFFKLSFGAQDKIAEKLDALNLGSQIYANPYARDRLALRAALQESDLADTESLMVYVPYRLLRPFLESSMTGVDKGSGPFERALPKIANAHFATVRPLYRFDSDDCRQCSAILFHPDWAAYLETHFPIIQGWAAWHWLHYMQRRNPATPALSSKLFPPAKRDTLTPQTRYWRTILTDPDRPELRCIYSGETLQAEKFALDHYLPWSFVAHDQIWNLIPAPPGVNSAKSNHLPSAEYFQSFVALQHQGLLAARRLLPAGAFGKVTEDYLSDLHLPSFEALLDFERLYHAYARNISPLLALAANQGFSPDWRYAR